MTPSHVLSHPPSHPPRFLHPILHHRRCLLVTHTPSYTHTHTVTHLLSPTLSCTLSPTLSPPPGSCTQSSTTDAAYWSDTSNTWSGNGYFPKFPGSCPYVTAVGATSARASNGNVDVIAAESNNGTGGGGVMHVLTLEVVVLYTHSFPFNTPSGAHPLNSPYQPTSKNPPSKPPKTHPLTHPLNPPSKPLKTHPLDTL